LKGYQMTTVKTNGASGRGKEGEYSRNISG
jgi:hypothetical protein